MRDTCVCVRAMAAMLIMLLSHYMVVLGVVQQRHSDRDYHGSSAVTSYYQHAPYGPNTYAFGYEVNDNRTGNVQFRDERRFRNGSLLGSYGYVRPDGRVTITHFVSDALSGYLSHTQTYSRSEGDLQQPQWQNHWPTMRPALNVMAGNEPLPLNGTHDESQRLNVTVGGVAPATANALMQQHGVVLDVKPGDLVGQVLSPSLIDILNGQVPVQKKPVKGGGGGANATVGFETVHNFIPSDFPLTPFEPPPAATPTPAPHKINKYDRAKENNAEKIPYLLQAPQQPLTLGNSEPAPLSAPAGVAGVGQQHGWYERLINATRREFLENLPNLQ